MEKDALTFPGGSTFPRWRGSSCIFRYKPIEFVIFQGTGVRTPATSSGSASGIVNWIRRHIVLAKRLSMTLTPLMQVLCGCGKHCLVIGDSIGVSRVVHRVLMAFCAMGYCIIPNVGCEGSFYI